MADNTDCDDTDAGEYPGADELCDGDDDDCNGDVDENDAIDVATWYPDTDEDGYGTDDGLVYACDAVEGYAALGGDCDDGSTSYHPGAEESDCTDPNDYNCDGSTGYIDADGDGWAACEECDDASGINFPGADEYCDGSDNDCDGDVDENEAVDADTWYADGDGDTFGSAAEVTVACAQPSGFVADNTDCDDTDAGEYPGADELCDGDDDDCNGDVDENDAIDAATWYTDADSDGFGDATTGAPSCSAPTGSVASGDDCNDADGDVSPSATELCDLIDNNCDGAVDEATAADASLWYLDADDDGFGDPDVAEVACTEPADHVADAADCDDSNDAVNPAALEVCEDGVDDDCSGSDLPCIILAGPYTSADAIRIEGTSSTVNSGADVGVGDMTGDGVDDVLIGAQRGASGAGAAYVVQGPVAADTSLAAPFATAEGEYNHAWLGLWGVAFGDFDNDGFGSLGLMGYQEKVGTISVYIVPNGASGTVSLADASALELRISETISVDEYGEASIANVGDLDDDGVADLAVGEGSYLAGPNGSYAGRVYLFHNLDDATPTSLADAYLLSGEFGGDLTGSEITSGDLTGDGASDMVVGARSGADGEGRVYVVADRISASGNLVDLSRQVLTGSTSSDQIGTQLTVADLDNDGYDDLLASAVGADTVWVMAGTQSASGELSALATLTINGSSGNFGFSACTGDLDGSGELDLVVGNRLDTAAVFVDVAFSSSTASTLSASSDAIEITSTPTGGFSYSLVCNHDVSGDGVDDLVIGDVGNSTSSTGDVWIFDATAW